MRIGQLAQAIDLPTSTIRFYEQKGLLPPAARTAKGYRQYDAHAIERLKMIKFATSLGFSLDDLPGLFASGEGLDHQQVMGHLRERKQDIDDLMAKLERQKSQMMYLMHRLEELWKAGHCMTACELDGLLEGLNMDNVREV
ncbi:MerR family transcriptional regulator [Alteromonas sp. 009811495]|uniref:MerR family transcriptional regulator n=1 Tax=Alteromonas sp. 009811495 TaxID=3002962 RepID=UPI00237E3D9D|nr:MerR family transcriptional regulator [Alteromonas sp. 009811495]WDT85183.1 MerR family transcriptional regulator [Alteromonas sp. 009811495]